MPPNPNKTRCSKPDCRAWAIRGSDPPLCSPHSRKAGAPEGNRNHLVHGYYAATVSRQELDDLAGDAADVTLNAEIAITRIALRRILGILITGHTPGSVCPTCGKPQPLDAYLYARFAALAFQGTGTISRLLRAQRALGGDPGDGIPDWMNQALDELSEEWRIQL